jgi:DNA (cytosine-5)-methyltransferase 1
VFLVASLGSGRSAEVLFERESGTGNNPSSKEAGKVSATLFASGAGTSRPAGTASEIDFLIPVNVFGGNKRKDRPEGGFYVEENAAATKTLDQTGLSPQLSQGGTLIIEQNNFVSTPDMISLRANPAQPLISFDANRDGLTYNEELAPTLKHGGDGDKAHNAYAKISVTQAQGVRRLTPTECERLQGFPDGWTDGQSDSARYRQLGNAVAVPVVEWIAKRIIKAQTRTTPHAPDVGESAPLKPLSTPEVDSDLGNVSASHPTLVM